MSLTRLRYVAGSFGAGELVAEGGRLVHHELPRPLQGPPRASSRFQPTVEIVAGGERDRVGSVTIVELAERLRSYFSGERPSFAEVELDLDWCSPFQRALAEALRALPYGETITYGELAARAGYPRAQRAAGTFCARNPLPILLPCHRVVARDGIGGFASLGVGYKQRLLELEGAL
jgi:O-6-methylguanine DNA methyltransferase